MREKLSDIIPYVVLASFLIFFYIIPLSFSLSYAVLSNGVLTYRNLAEIFSKEIFWKALYFTFYQAMLSTLISLLLGLPGAYILSKYDFPGKRIFSAMSLVPFMTPSIIVAFGFMMLYGRYGIVTKILRSIGANIVLGEGLIGIVLAHAFFNTPMVMHIVASIWTSIDPELEDVARVLGGRGFYIFRRVILPQISTGILVAALLTFILCFTSFTIVLILGGARYMTLEVLMYMYYYTLFDKMKASSIALIQLLIIAIFSIAYFKVLIKYSITIKAGGLRIPTYKKLVEKPKDLLHPQKLVLLIYIIAITIYLFSPYAIIIRDAFFDPIKDTFNLKGFFGIFSLTRNPYYGSTIVNILINTLYYAFLTVFIAVTLSLLVARALREKPESSAILGAITVIPLGTSSITLGIGLLFAYGGTPLVTVFPWVLIVTSHAAIAMPFALRTIYNAITQIEPEIYEAADSLGADTLMKVFKIESPLLLPSIATAAALSAATSLGEFAATNLIARGDYITLTVAMYRLIATRQFQAAGAMGLVLVILSFLSFLITLKTQEYLTKTKELPI